MCMIATRVEVNFIAGTSIEKAIEVAVGFSSVNQNCDVAFTFNGIYCQLNSKSNKEVAHEQYLAACAMKVTG